jgi:hypothetical protein
MIPIMCFFTQNHECFHCFRFPQKSFRCFHFVLRTKLILRLTIESLIAKFLHLYHFLLVHDDFHYQIQHEFALGWPLRNYVLAHYEFINHQDLSFNFLLNQNQIEIPLPLIVNAYQIIRIFDCLLLHLHRLSDFAIIIEIIFGQQKYYQHLSLYQ